MVDVHHQLQAGYVVADFAHVHRFVVMAGRAPNQPAAAVGHDQGVAAAHRHDQPRLLGPLGQADHPPAVGVPAVPPSLLGLEDPANRAVRVQRSVSGQDFVAAVAVKVDGQGLMRGRVAAGLVDRPAEAAIGGVGPDLSVAGLDQNLRGPPFARQVGEGDTIAGVRLDGEGACRFPRTAVEDHQLPIGRHDDLACAIVVQVVDLASHVVVEFPASELRVAPSPEDAAIEFLNRHRRGEVVVILVEVPRRDNLDLAVAVHVARHNPITAVLRVERQRPPGSDNRHIGRGGAAGVGFEGTALLRARRRTAQHGARYDGSGQDFRQNRGVSVHGVCLPFASDTMRQSRLYHRPLAVCMPDAGPRPQAQGA